MQKLLDIMTSPMSVPELAALAKASHVTVGRHIKRMHDDGKVHIAKIRRDQYRKVALWIAGPGQDAELPVEADLPEEEIFKRPRTVVNVQRDPLVAALFGAA